MIAPCVAAGLDYRQAAEALGIPGGTVRSRLSRARKPLAELSAVPARDTAGEPDRASGEKDGEAVFAALLLQEETRSRLTTRPPPSRPRRKNCWPPRPPGTTFRRAAIGASRTF
ncbi:sigma factor-like helix-turn-helix DNA-binding protein [Streptomyces sp. NPDC008139]|uniref:RNA polymerase sigma factor n=1 Tax=Streptomyces sp. NPDC008139 TaxID=3364814 RepID=UPI0036EC16E6